jgi:hypothetical protein
MPPKKILQLMLACGLLTIAAFYFSGTMASPRNSVACPQPDTLIYCQYAQQMALGQPYIFSPGDKPSTGSTSHLYPAILAGLYKLGAHGEMLLSAGFALNALFYLIFIFNWWVIISRLAPRSLLTAGLLVTLSGHAAYCAMAQSDVGLFMAVSSGAFAALLAGRTGWLTALLVLAPWSRPEGIVLAFVLAGTVGWKQHTSRERDWRQWIPVALALLSSAAVLGFNWLLTGMTQYQSVYHKGHFKAYDFGGAVAKTLADLTQMMRELFFGVATNIRQHYFVPVVGAVLAWLGMAVRPWRRTDAWKEAWWFIACMVSILLVATSGWQVLNLDRYLSWLLPIWLVYAAEGATFLSSRLPGDTFRHLPQVVLVGYQIMSLVMAAGIFYSSSLEHQRICDFFSTVHRQMPARLTTGGVGASGLVYCMPGRSFRHMSGIVSPDLLSSDPVLNIERLKYHPELRFDVWIAAYKQSKLESAKQLLGEPIQIGIHNEAVYLMNWKSLDAAIRPVDPDVLKKLQGWTLVDQVDVGYPEEETRTRYASFAGERGVTADPIIVSGKIGTNALTEVGRIITGYDQFTVKVRPNQPVILVMRSVRAADASLTQGMETFQNHFEFNEKLLLAVQIDQASAGQARVQMPANSTDMVEVSFDIPAKYFTKPEATILILGGRIALDYWVYQPKAQPETP